MSTWKLGRRPAPNGSPSASISPTASTQLAGGRWLPLNRLYKPLGVASRAYVDYERFAHVAVQFTTDPREQRDVWVQQSPTHLWLSATTLRAFKPTMRVSRGWRRSCVHGAEIQRGLPTAGHARLNSMKCLIVRKIGRSIA
jgi:hypothetical protein